jgi:phospholipase/carboxylesterase
MFFNSRMKTLRTETPDAIILSPAQGTARAAVIWLHGLGADGADFVPLVPELQLAADAGIRFVFPHADLRPVTVNSGYTMRAWYDIRSLTPEGRDDEEGLRDSAQRVLAYIARERVAGIASERILLAGFSQGAALALYAGLRHDERLGGIVALSGYLPMRDKLAAEGTAANRNTPILMCHGTADGVVDIDFGRQSRDALIAAGHAVDFREYPMEHSLHPAEVRDIAVFIRSRLA